MDQIATDGCYAAPVSYFYTLPLQTDRHSQQDRKNISEDPIHYFTNICDENILI